MKKSLTKVLAVLLSIALLTSLVAVFASAAYQANQDYSVYPELAEFEPGDEVYPTIILPGINHSKTYLADENGVRVTNSNGAEIGGGLLILDDSSIVSDVIGLIPSALFSLFLQRTMPGLSDSAYKAVHKVMGIMQMDNDGVPVNNLVTEYYDYPVSQMDEDTRAWFYRMIPMEPYAALFGEDNIYLYTFPLFGDPMESASGLHDYIDMVKEQSGAEKVNIISISLGGTILSAFLDSNPDYSEINKIVDIVAVLNGTDLIADFMARRFNLSDEFLYSDYLPLIMKETTGSAATGYLLNIVLRILPKKTLYDLLTAAFSAILDTVILNDPQFWATLPGDEYEALADRYLRDGNHDVLLAKTDRFQTARVNLTDNMKAAADAGVRIYNIAGYGLSFTQGDYSFFGIVESSATVNSDAIIPIGSTTLGANSVPAGKTFSAEYLASADSKYISPDKSVDASTCLFPDTTWFFADQHHEVGRNDVVIRLAVSVIAGLVDDVNSSAAFPQFISSRNTRSLVRSDSGYIFKAQAVLNDTTGAYSESEKAIVKAAYDEAVAMLADTTGGQEKATAASDALYDALAQIGVVNPKAPESSMTSFYERLLKAINDRMMKHVGGNGFSDVNT